MKRLRVLIVSPCQGAYGGIEAFVLAIAQAARAEADLDVRVVFKKVAGFELKPTLEDMTRNENVEFIERGSMALARAISWADVVHLQNASPDVIAVAKLFGKPLALTIHNYMADGASLHRRLWRIGARLANARWYNSQFVWNTWEREQKLPGSRKVPTVSRLPIGLTPPDARRGFIFIGRWIANKGIDTLLDAYASARINKADWPLTLIGDGPLRAEVGRRVAADANVELLGFVDETTKTQRLQCAKWIVVPPSTNEDFGLTAIEGRHLGVPCIITRDGGLPEAGGAEALVCEPRDVSGLAQLLETAATMSEGEYARRSEATSAALAHELVPLTFYPAAYRALAAGIPVP